MPVRLTDRSMKRYETDDSSTILYPNLSTMSNQLPEILVADETATRSRALPAIILVRISGINRSSASQMVRRISVGESSYLCTDMLDFVSSTKCENLGGVTAPVNRQYSSDHAACRHYRYSRLSPTAAAGRVAPLSRCLTQTCAWPMESAELAGSDEIVPGSRAQLRVNAWESDSRFRLSAQAAGRALASESGMR